MSQGIFAPEALQRLRFVTEELNPARPFQAEAGVPVHESVKITLGTILSVSSFSYGCCFLLSFLFKHSPNNVLAVQLAP